MREPVRQIMEFAEIVPKYISAEMNSLFPEMQSAANSMRALVRQILWWAW